MKYIFNPPAFNQKMCELFGVEDSGYSDDFQLPDNVSILEPWNKGIKTGPISQEHKNKISNGVRKTLLESWKDPDFRKSRCESMRGKTKSRVNLKYVYEIITPDGTKVTINNLTDYCRKNNLSEENLRKVIRGKRKHHKNYTAKILSLI